MAPPGAWAPSPALAAAVRDLRVSLTACSSKKSAQLWRQLTQQSIALDTIVTGLMPAIQAATAGGGRYPQLLQHLLADGTLFALLPATLCRLLTDGASAPHSAPPPASAASPAAASGSTAQRSAAAAASVSMAEAADAAVAAAAGAAAATLAARPTKQVLTVCKLLLAVSVICRELLWQAEGAANPEALSALEAIYAAGVCPALCAAMALAHRHIALPPVPLAAGVSWELNAMGFAARAAGAALQLCLRLRPSGGAAAAVLSARYAASLEGCLSRAGAVVLSWPAVPPGGNVDLCDAAPAWGDAATDAILAAFCYDGDGRGPGNTAVLAAAAWPGSVPQPGMAHLMLASLKHCAVPSAPHWCRGSLSTTARVLRCWLTCGSRGPAESAALMAALAPGLGFNLSHLAWLALMHVRVRMGLDLQTALLALLTMVPGPPPGVEAVHWGHIAGAIHAVLAVGPSIVGLLPADDTMPTYDGGEHSWPSAWDSGSPAAEDEDGGDDVALAPQRAVCAMMIMAAFHRAPPAVDAHLMRVMAAGFLGRCEAWMRDPQLRTPALDVHALGAAGRALSHLLNVLLRVLPPAAAPAAPAARRTLAPAPAGGAAPPRPPPHLALLATLRKFSGGLVRSWRGRAEGMEVGVALHELLLQPHVGRALEAGHPAAHILVRTLALQLMPPVTLPPLTPAAAAAPEPSPPAAAAGPSPTPAVAAATAAATAAAAAEVTTHPGSWCGRLWADQLALAHRYGLADVTAAAGAPSRLQEHLETVLAVEELPGGAGCFDVLGLSTAALEAVEAAGAEPGWVLAEGLLQAVGRALELAAPVAAPEDWRGDEADGTSEEAAGGNNAAAHLARFAALASAPCNDAPRFVRCAREVLRLVRERGQALPPGARVPASWDSCLLATLALAPRGGADSALRPFFGCWHRGCTNLGGPSEASLKLLKCALCLRARYCSTECQQAAWEAGHRPACKAWRQRRDAPLGVPPTAVEQTQ